MADEEESELQSAGAEDLTEQGSIEEGNEKFRIKTFFCANTVWFTLYEIH